ncbi:hypothetical protein [Streptomyces bobili]|uniref:hypothetical protein n=1 Tax=Streptomyces bobili TaxID=67280 RepID=UPI0037F73CD0
MTVQRLWPLLALEPVSLSTDSVDGLWMDGTLIPVREQKDDVSISENAQVIISAEVACRGDRPVPGNQRSGLAGHCEGVTVQGDGIHVNTGKIPCTGKVSRYGSELKLACEHTLADDSLTKVADVHRLEGGKITQEAEGSAKKKGMPRRRWMAA